MIVNLSPSYPKMQLENHLTIRYPSDIFVIRIPSEEVRNHAKAKP